MLRNAKIRFFTKDDDKDHDTLISIFIRVGNTRIASLENYGQGITFRDWETYEVPLRVDAPEIAREAAVQGISTQIVFRPVGNDTWRFWYLLSLEFEPPQQPLDFERQGEDVQLPPFLGGRTVHVDMLGLSENRRDVTWYDSPKR